MAAALRRSQQAKVWANILPAAEVNAAGALWQVIAGRVFARVDELRLLRGTAQT